MRAFHRELGRSAGDKVRTENRHTRMKKLLRVVLPISVGSCNLWSQSLCISTNKPRKGKRVYLESFLPQRTKCQYILLLRMCSDLQSPDAPQLVNCVTHVIWKISVPRLDGDCLTHCRGWKPLIHVSCLETPVSLNKDHH